MANSINLTQRPDTLTNGKNLGVVPVSPWLLEAVKELVGPITLDVAADDQHHVTPDYYTIEQNGLVQLWYGTSWCNPPYQVKVLHEWVAKAIQEFRRGVTVVLYLPYWPSYEWFDWLVELGTIYLVTGSGSLYKRSNTFIAILKPGQPGKQPFGRIERPRSKPRKSQHGHLLAARAQGSPVATEPPQLLAATPGMVGGGPVAERRLPILKLPPQSRCDIEDKRPLAGNGHSPTSSGRSVTERPTDSTPCKPSFPNGNTKTGQGIYLFNLPVEKTCPGASPTCRKDCYGKGEAFRMKKVLASHHHNLRCTQCPNWIECMVATIQAKRARIVRWHDTGDFYSAEQVESIIRIVEATPDVIYYCYTRSWNVPTLLPLLLKLAALPNFRMWFSLDRDMPVPEKRVGIKRCYFAISDRDIPPVDVDVVFRKLDRYNKDANRITRLGNSPVCPHEREPNAKKKPTCVECRLCFDYRKRGTNGKAQASAAGRSDSRSDFPSLDATLGEAIYTPPKNILISREVIDLTADEKDTLARLDDKERIVKARIRTIVQPSYAGVRGLVLCGPAGHGKTSLLTTELNGVCGDPDKWSLYNSDLSPPALLAEMEAHREKPLVIEDCEQLLANVKNRGILRSAMAPPYRVNPKNMKASYDFVFGAPIYIVSNLSLDERHGVLAAIASRSGPVHWQLTQAELVARMKYIALHIERDDLTVAERFEVAEYCIEQLTHGGRVDLRTLCDVGFPVRQRYKSGELGVDWRDYIDSYVRGTVEVAPERRDERISRERHIACEVYLAGKNTDDRHRLWKERTHLEKTAFHDRLAEARASGLFNQYDTRQKRGKPEEREGIVEQMAGEDRPGRRQNIGVVHSARREVGRDATEPQVPDKKQDISWEDI
jgi:hypothetical protein